MKKTDKKIEKKYKDLTEDVFKFQISAHMASILEIEGEMLVELGDKYYKIIEELTNLIQQSNEVAVKNTILSIMSKVPTIMPHDKPDYILRSDFDRAIKETEKQFLTQQSLDKGEECQE
jgi:hypothetical protein